MRKIFTVIITTLLLTHNITAYEDESYDERVKYDINKIVKDIRTKKFKKAISGLKKIIKKSPENLRAKLLLGKCYYSLHNYEKAVNVYGTILSNSPRNVYALLEIANSYQKMFKIDKAIYFYKIVKKVLKSNPYPVYGLIQANLIKGKFVKVREHLDHLEEMRMSYSQMGLIIDLFKLKILDARNMNMEAYELLERALYDYGEHNKILLLEKFDFLYDMSNLNKASELINRLYKSGYKSREVFRGLIKLSIDFKEYNKAQTYLEEYNKKFGNTHDYYYLKYMVAKKVNKTHGIRYLLKSLARNRFQINAHYALIEEYVSGNKIILANQWLNQFMNLFKEVKGIDYLKIKIFYKMGKKKQSIILLKKLLKENDHDLSLLINASYFLWIKVKDYNFALRLMKHALNIYPNNERLLNNIAYFYATVDDKGLRKPKLALKYAKRAVKITKNLNAAFLDTLAAAYYACGKVREALETQKRVINLNPVDKSFRENILKYRSVK